MAAATRYAASASSPLFAAAPRFRESAAGSGSATDSASRRDARAPPPSLPAPLARSGRVRSAATASRIAPPTPVAPRPLRLSEKPAPEPEEGLLAEENRLARAVVSQILRCGAAAA